jgi:ankyrin repeat protein
LSRTKFRLYLESSINFTSIGANVNHQDRFGRSPLHVAAAVDYASMVEFIVQNGGDIHIKTKGEEQTAIHYAAKNDAVNSLQMLLGHGAKIDSADCRNRTPLQVAFFPFH